MTSSQDGSIPLPRAALSPPRCPAIGHPHQHRLLYTSLHHTRATRSPPRAGTSLIQLGSSPQASHPSPGLPMDAAPAQPQEKGTWSKAQEAPPF